ncbi:DDB1- and CUL4-associated factor 8-like [Bacillus rossius redtenbacheri]|uniref:DDB1- and CUL4-associated factor 8-like n=1 Tax=Bacillus rossius redtenbacheri TaxID=93214 RepID=UPI002FDD0A85
MNENSKIVNEMDSSTTFDNSNHVDKVSEERSEGNNKTSSSVTNGVANDIDGTLLKSSENVNTNKRQMKKHDSGISVEKSENSSDDETSKRQKGSLEKHSDAESAMSECGPSNDRGATFLKLKSNSKHRNYRSKKSGGKATLVESNSDDDSHTPLNHGSLSAHEEGTSLNSGVSQVSSSKDGVDNGEEDDIPLDTYDIFGPVEENRNQSEQVDSGSEDSNYGDGASNAAKGASTESEADDEEEEITPSVLLKKPPKHKWCIVKEVVNRQWGAASRCKNAEMFQQRCYGSLHCVQRLELMYKMERHHGCVNALHFNSTGQLLASGSDDQKVIVWDWHVGKPRVSYDSGHRNNVFQARFMPLLGDTHIASCGRDGQVRLAELSSTGTCRSTRRLAQHRGPAHKLAIHVDTPHIILSSGEDSAVMNIDIRDQKQDKLLYVKEGERKISLYSIHINPMNSNEFCISGRDSYIRIYDRRKIPGPEHQVKKFCPRHLGQATPGTFTHVTCAMFNYNGTEIMGTYNDEDIYLFDTRNPDGADYIHRYEGHRNNATVKGVNFFGPRSEFIVSGSDCGNIFFWEKESEAIVQWMPGDENGVVNCLEPHPQMPILASSGLDDDIKIWVPSCEHEPSMEGLKSAVVANYRGREDDRLGNPDGFDGQMMWILWRHIRRTDRRRCSHNNAESPTSPAGRSSQTHSGAASGPSEPDGLGSSSSSSDSDEASHRVQCSPS